MQGQAGRRKSNPTPVKEKGLKVNVRESCVCVCVSVAFPHLEASEKCVLLSVALCERLLPGHEWVHSMAVGWGKPSWWPTQNF